MASVYFHISNNIANTSVRSPFGTVEFSKRLPAEILYKFLMFVEGDMQSTGIERIIIKNPPYLYAADKIATMESFLFNLGYNTTSSALGSIRFTHDDFVTKLHRLEISKLKKSADVNLNARFLSAENLDQVFDFILSCRKSKGYVLSMTLNDLKDTIGHFPDRYLFSGVFLGSEMIAASISIRVTSEILYNFYADHSATYNHLSPVVVLIKSLYEYCQQNKILMLDFGTSAVNGQPNFGLLKFKARLGGQPSPKLTFEKILKG